MSFGEIGPTHFGPLRERGPISSVDKRWWELCLCKERGTIAMTTRREYVDCAKCIELLREKDKV